MTFFLQESKPAQLPPIPSDLPDQGDAVSAAWQSERIRTDHWNRRANLAADYYEELRQDLGDRVKPLPWDTPHRLGPALDRRVNDLVEQIAVMDGQDPVEPLANLPRTRDDFDKEVWRRLRAQYDEAQQVLGLQPQGSISAQIIGALGVGATDEVTLATLPLGLEGGPVWRIMLGEATLNAGLEAAMLPRQFQAAEGLGIDPPKPLEQMAVAGLTGGLLGGGIAGITRGAKYLRTGQTALGAQRPAGVSPLDYNAALNDAINNLENDKPLQLPAAASVPEIGKFDFSASGNASPKTNRVGYVFGRLLEMGYEPHIAAGLTGNFMQESTPALNARAIGDNGASFGIGQWNKSRKDQLFEFARIQKKNPDDLDTQIAFLDHELKTTQNDAWQRIQSATTADEAALLASQHYWRPGVPHNERRISYARSVMTQFSDGGVPRWNAVVSTPAEDAPIFTTNRGYTRPGSVTAGDSFRVDVEYEVADAELLQPASGEFQPRDRTRAASDEQIAEIAARLDPARLMPSPEADRGAPLVGPDGMIESGNGRVAAIRRAYERHPDRAAEYRSQIEAQGFTIPEDMAQPVLIARRQTPLDDTARGQLVREANTSAVARMSPTERAGADARAIDQDMLDLVVPDRPLTDPANKAFVARVLAAMPQAERNGLVDSAGRLNAEGERRIGHALFANAFDAPDIVARATESGAGDLKSLMDALQQAAPDWARLRAAVAAGELRADADITPYVLDAMRLIANARALAARDGLETGAALAELLNDVDLLDGAISPLTQALVKKFWKNGRAAKAADIADFLKRYAAEAQKVAHAGNDLLGDAPGAAEILRAIDKDAFGQLPDDLDFPGTSPESTQRDPRQLQAGEAPILVRQLAMKQPFDDLDAAYEMAGVVQSALDRVGRVIAKALDVEWKNPGIKKRITVEEKIARKMYDSPRRLTDIARGGFAVKHASEADNLVRRLAASFDIVDEGWVQTAVGYTDRKVIVRHENGMLAEVQIWTAQMFKAKGVGTELYTKSRSLKPTDPERATLLAEQIEIYSAANVEFSEEMLAASGMSNLPNELSNRSLRAASSDRTPAVFQTSSASTFTQSLPGSSSANASTGVGPSITNTAGRQSQSQNFSENDISGSPFFDDNANMGRQSEQVNTSLEMNNGAGSELAVSADRIALDELRAEFSDEALELPDGTTLTGREILDDIEADQELADVLALCNAGGAGA